MVPHDPINVAAALLGLYAAMYLAFGVIVHVLTPPDASAAVAPDVSMAPSATATALPLPVHNDESPSCHALGPVAKVEATDNPIECRPGAASDYQHPNPSPSRSWR